MTRVELAALLGFLAGVVFTVFFLTWATPGFQVVDCTRENPYGSPATQVDVYTTRHEHIDKHYLFGCTFYSYQPAPFH